MALFSHAGTIAFVYMVIETEIVFSGFYTFLCHNGMARPRTIETLAEIKECIHCGKVAVGTVIAGTSILFVSGFEYTWKIFVRDGYVGIGLVIF